MGPIEVSDWTATHLHVPTVDGTSSIGAIGTSPTAERMIYFDENGRAE